MLKLYISLFVLFTCGFLFSQEKGSGKVDKIKQLKIVYITEQLELSPTEAEQFWPIYRELELKLKQLKKESKKIQEIFTNNIETISEEELAKKMDQLFKNQIEETNLKREYFNKFAKVIGYKKTTKLLAVDKEFKQKLLKELKKRKENQINNK